ncbi:acyltransferase [Salinibacterium sp. NSLL150]|uniref:acyltransferase family protein n=1 Tax=unclassified Salinibacterium TaxID=2632331 RepID=UPI0018CD0648|nr:MULTISPECIES: acyltransferase family protein [unclassified Salinibacterium]MBH0099816.1 acyltransferase [Salinibacterium sp. NSLL35]MBH0102570.1 acyltransferase [Salinibacterium sp. NSLL150]MBH0105330.1 acyltransferase [Salinibacterium sp. NSLL16]MBH0108090.1 acyltransferase [Salinibacterium sp. NSLL17]
MSKVQNSKAPTRLASWFRGDINGLRVLAIVPVVAFHAGFPGFGGGFIGVDVFYVISGFLITTNLLREVEATGRINIGQFWAKRVRRLVPASVLMVLVTLPLAAWLLSPLQWADLGRAAASTLLYVSNFLFSQQATDYFTVDLGDPSPFLHTWSLGVEEQFYVLWPLVVIAAAVIAHRRGVAIRRVLFIAFSATILLSFLLALIWTQTAPSAAFYLLPARAWEFAAAGLLALLPGRYLGAKLLRSLMTVIGAAVLLATVVLLPETTPFPGFAALLPVAATMLIILGGRRADDEVPALPARVLAIAPMQWVGNLSYSWYLWHWPFIVLAGVAFESERLRVTVGAAAASFVAAAITYYLVENPIRFNPALVRSLRRTFISAAAVTVVGLLLAGGAVVQGNLAVQEYRLIEQARADKPAPECDRETTVVSGVNLCEMGDVDSPVTVVLVGDSHAGQWKDALAEAAKQENIRLVVRWLTACAAIGVDTLSSKGEFTEGCQGFVQDTENIIEEIEPDAVLISQAEAYDGRIVEPDGGALVLSEQLDLWRASYDNTIILFETLGARVGVIQDNPRVGYDPSTCLVRSGGDAEGCASPRDEALEMTAVLQAVAKEAIEGHDLAVFYTTNDTLCDEEVCKVMDGDVPVYRDYNHLSRQWTMTQIPDLREMLVTLVGSTKVG